MPRHHPPLPSWPSSLCLLLSRPRPNSLTPHAALLHRVSIRNWQQRGSMSSHHRRCPAYAIIHHDKLLRLLDLHDLVPRPTEVVPPGTNGRQKVGRSSKTHARTQGISRNMSMSMSGGWGWAVKYNTRPLIETSTDLPGYRAKPHRNRSDIPSPSHKSKNAHDNMESRGLGIRD